MEQIRKVALAYYKESSDETKEHVKKLFKKIDADGNRKVSLDEFNEYCRRKSKKLPKHCFNELDKNGDGFLDFEEIIVFFYIIQTRTISCSGCGSLVMGMYFTCAICFYTETSVNHNLCCSCHQSGKSAGCEHSNLVDNYALLQGIKTTVKTKKIADKAGEFVVEKIEEWAAETLQDKSEDLLDAVDDAIEAVDDLLDALDNACIFM
uniref:EF-hand domain-containing protein n=1 Tax=Nelumbo nucifera TaxID=4432 RepID=A0A822Z2T8_NELNU|nr:TPA_asm: hypothetical protein HUJ06_013665 [Nelumbo nucifera]